MLPAVSCAYQVAPSSFLLPTTLGGDRELAALERKKKALTYGSYFFSVWRVRTGLGSG